MGCGESRLTLNAGLRKDIALSRNESLRIDAWRRSSALRRSGHHLRRWRLWSRESALWRRRRHPTSTALTASLHGERLIGVRDHSLSDLHDVGLPLSSRVRHHHLSPTTLLERDRRRTTRPWAAHRYRLTGHHAHRLTTGHHVLIATGHLILLTWSSLPLDQNRRLASLHRRQHTWWRHRRLYRHSGRHHWHSAHHRLRRSTGRRSDLLRLL